MANTAMLNQLIQTNTADQYLRAGQMNPYVKELQTLLHELGYDQELMWQVYGADSYFGDPTIKAVKAFGARNGMATNGMSVPPAMLNRMIQSKSAPPKPATSSWGQPTQPAKPAAPAQPASSGWGQPTQPAKPAAPAPAASSLKTTDQGDKVQVSDGKNTVTFSKRDNGLAYWGSKTIESVIKANRNVIRSIGITDSALNVMISVSENEGKLDAINSYDKAFFSFGIFQWTIGVDSGTGELPALLKKYKTKFASSFKSFFGNHGLDISSDTTDTYGYLTLNGTKIDSPSKKEQFRKPEWAFYFWLAGQDPNMHAVEIDHALGRLKSFYWNTKYAIGGFTLSEIITSEYGVALLLDHHVNRPAYVQPSVQQAMQQTGLNNPTFWGDAEEQKVLDAYLKIRETYTSGSYAPMTKAKERAAVTQKYLSAGTISNRRESFQASPSMMG